MKKGETSSYSFLIGIILTIFILSGVGCAVYQIYKPQSKESFDDLAAFLKKIEKEGQNVEGMTPFYGENDMFLLSFNKNEDYVLKDVSINVFALGARRIFPVQRPADCDTDKSCLCLCRVGVFPEYSGEDSCKLGKCETFDSLEFQGEVPDIEPVFIIGFGTKTDEDRGVFSLHYQPKETKLSFFS